MALKPKDVRVLLPVQLILDCSSSTPECNLDDGAGQHLGRGGATRVALPTPIPLVYNTASLIGVDLSMCIPLYLIWPYYRNIMC